MHRLYPLIAILFALPLEAADQPFSATAEKRHEKVYRVTEENSRAKTMCGDWCGVRGRLADKGITTTASYVMDVLGNPYGGEKQDFSHAGSLGLDFMADLEHLWGWSGWKFYFAWTWRTGTNLSKKIGNQFPVAQVFGGETWRLNVLYLKKSWLDGALSVKFGRLQGGDDFLQSPLYYNYVSNAIDGNPIGIFFNTFFTAYPNATWGAYAEAKPLPRLLWKVAIYNANAEVNENQYNGFNFQFKNTQGIQWITEATYLVNTLPGDSGLPGHYKAAIYYYTGKYDKFLAGKTRGNYGYYFLFDQMVYRRGGAGSDIGLTPFVSLLFAPEDRNTFPFFFTSGLVYKGLFPRRSQDVTAAGIAYGSYSSDLRASQRNAKMEGIAGAYGSRPQNFEMIIELNHAFNITPWFYIQPDLQYIINPKGYDDIDNALVLGAQVGVVF